MKYKYHEYALPFCDLNFHLLVSFDDQKLILMNFKLSIFFLLVSAFCILSKKSFLIPRLWGNLLMFSLTFLYFYIYDIFKITFGSCVRKIRGSINFSTIYWKDFPFSIELFGTFVKSQLSIYVWVYFWIFCLFHRSIYLSWHWNMLVWLL